MDKSNQVIPWNHARPAIFIALAVVLLVLSSFAAAHKLIAVDDGSESGTIPPYLNLSTSASPNSEVQPGADVTFTISLLKVPSTYSVTLAITNTVPVTLSLLPGSLHASTPEQPQLGTDNTVLWTGFFSPTESETPVTTTVTISYVLQAPECNGTPSQELKNVVVLQELPYPVVTKAPEPVIKTHEITLIGCISYLPNIQRPPFPALVNGNLAQGFNVGWGQQPFPLIYAKSSIPAIVQTDANSDYVAWLGGVSNDTNTLTQTIGIPAEYRIKLKLRYYTASAEPATGADTAKVLVVSNGVITEKRSYPLSVDKDTNRWESDTIDLSEYSGKEIELRFESVLNGTRNSNWFLNSFELCAAGSDGC